MAERVEFRGGYVALERGQIVHKKKSLVKTKRRTIPLSAVSSVESEQEGSGKLLGVGILSLLMGFGFLASEAVGWGLFIGLFGAMCCVLYAKLKETHLIVRSGTDEIDIAARFGRGEALARLARKIRRETSKLPASPHHT